MTPVAVLTLGGNRCIVAGFGGSDWVKNARHAVWAELSRGRRRERVLLDEVPVEERPPILREFARQVRGGRSFLTFAADASDLALAKASPQHPVFLVPDLTRPPRPAHDPNAQHPAKCDAHLLVLCGPPFDCVKLKL